MDLRQLRYFSAVVEAGSVTAAATQLHMSQPPLSVALAKLEAEVGVALLLRTARGVEPTSAGRYLLNASSRVLGEVAEIVSTLGRFGAGTAGSITMAAVPALMWHRVPALLRAHALEVPDVEITLIDPPPWTAIDMLQRQAVDLAAVLVADGRRFAQRYTATLDIVDWGEVPLVAALPPDAAEVPDTVGWTLFDGEAVVLPRRTAAVPSLPEIVEDEFRRHHVAPSTIRTVETIQNCIPLIEAGLVRGVLPDPDHASLRRFDMTVRRIEPEPEPLRALVLTRRDGAKNEAVARLLDRIARWQDHVR